MNKELTFEFILGQEIQEHQKVFFNQDFQELSNIYTSLNENSAVRDYLIKNGHERNIIVRQKMATVRENKDVLEALVKRIEEAVDKEDDFAMFLICRSVFMENVDKRRIEIFFDRVKRGETSARAIVTLFCKMGTFGFEPFHSNEVFQDLAEWVY